MHGSPPKDFPKKDLTELFELRAKLRQGKSTAKEISDRHDVLDMKMRQWPRTAANDPFYEGSMALGRELSLKTGLDVFVGFNEFCDPDLDRAIDLAVERGSGTVIVTTPMMTQGGAHSKNDIPAAIQKARQDHPNAKICYAWPFPVSAVAGFIADHLKTFLS